MKLAEILINQITQTETILSVSSIVGIYQYGSRVYGTAIETSDWDFVVINNNGFDFLFESDNVDIHYISIETYNNKLKEHDIMALETYYQNIYGEPIKEYEIEFKLDLQKLRKSVSSVCNNSFVKFKKKLILENEDNYIGIKSLYHSIRIAELGTKIAIGDHTMLKPSSYLWTTIKEDAEECNYDWETLNKKYKPIFNEEMSEFRKVAPKFPKS